MKQNTIALNLSDPVTQRKLRGRISQLRGLWELTLDPIRPTRSLQANKYYWISVIAPFKEWLWENWGDITITNEQAHVELKKNVLGEQEIVNEAGQKLLLVPDTHEMTTAEFATYIDHAAEWLARNCGIVVLPSELFVTKGETSE